MRSNHLGIIVLFACLTGSPALAAPGSEFATTDEGIVGTYRKTVPDIDFDASKARDEKNKPRVAQRQRQNNGAEGPIKTFTLRGIKDSPPYLHDGRLLTLEDTVEFFSLVLQLRLSAEEKQSLVAYMKAL